MENNLRQFKDNETEWRLLNSLNLELLAENIDYFCKYKDAAEWKGGPMGNGVIQFPYPIYPEGMNLNLLLEYIGGMDYEYDKHMKEISQTKLLPTDLNLAQIRSYMTFIIRGEKFCDGHIAEYMKNRVLLKLCLRLDDLARATMTKEAPRRYSLSYLKALKQDWEAMHEEGIGSRRVEHQEEVGKWCLKVQLDEDGKWFLRVAFKENGTFEKYTIEGPEKELRYDFTEETVFRENKSFGIWLESEYLLLDQILTIHIKSKGTEVLRTFVKTHHNPKKTRYYCMGSGLIFKINHENRSSYRLNADTMMWQEDASLLVDFEWGSVVDYKEIEIEDIYEIAVENDNGKGPEILVGRETNCDLCINNPAVSRQHALIYYDGVRWLVRDLNSKNGIKLNGKKVQVNVLNDCDQIQIGDCTISFYENCLHVCDNGKAEMVFLQKREILDQMIQKQKRSRYIGCLLGGAVGDALGYPVEFWSESQIANQFGEKGIQDLEQAGHPARISDDTQMTLFAANGLIHAKSNDALFSADIRTAYCEWLGTQGDTCGMDGVKNPKMWIYSDERLHALRAPGNTCLSAISRFAKDDTVKFAENNSKGCGTVMRAAPFGLAVHYDPIYSRGDDSNGVYKMAKYDAMLTHGHAAAHASSAALALMIYEIVQHCPTGKTSLQEVISGIKTGQSEVDRLLEQAILLAQDESVSDLRGIHMLGEGWIAEEALAIAVFCAVRYQNDFAKAIRAAVNHKGDSDSTGAICGNILGAWLGQEKVEASFDINNLELADVMIEISDDLYRSVEKKVPLPGADAEWDKKYR